LFCPTSLCVIAAELLDTLESWVLELFSNVKAGPLSRREIKDEGPIWHVGKLYRLEAVKDVHILELSWKLPCLRKDYLKKSEDYLAHLIGHGKSVADKFNLLVIIMRRMALVGFWNYLITLTG